MNHQSSVRAAGTFSPENTIQFEQTGFVWLSVRSAGRKTRFSLSHADCSVCEFGCIALVFVTQTCVFFKAHTVMNPNHHHHKNKKQSDGFQTPQMKAGTQLARRALLSVDV